MNRYLTFLLILLTWIKSCYSATQIWNVDFIQETTTENPNPQPNIIKLIKGKYMDVIVKMTPIEGEQLKNVQGDLKLIDQKVFKTPLASYSIDTMSSTTYSIEIGVACEEADGGETKIQFESDNLSLLISEITISYEKGSPYELKLTQFNPNIPVDAYGVLYSELNIKNVDPFDIDFASTVTSDTEAYIDSIKVPAYNGLENSQKIKTKFYFKTKPTRQNPTFDVILKSKCFKEASKVSFQYFEDVIPDPETNLNAIVKTVKQIITDMPGAISVIMAMEATPVISYCAIQSGYENILTDDEVINQSKPESYELKYSFNYYTDPTNSQIFFSGLSQFVSYSMKCIFESVHLNSPKQTVLTFGYLGNMDVKIPLIPEGSQDTPAQCITWRFNSVIEKTEFIDKAVPYCYEFFTDHNIPRNKNGCIECEERSVKDLYPVTASQTLGGICIRPAFACQSNYLKDLSAKTQELKDKLSTGAKIDQELELDLKTEVDTIFYENDEVVPDQKKIVMQDFALDFAKKKISFKLYTTEQKKIQCNATVSDKSVLGLTNFDYAVMYIPDPDKPTTTFEYDLNPFFNKDADLNFFIQCYNLPYFLYSISKTEPILLKQFIYKEKDYEINVPILPLDCTLVENKNKTQCIELEHSRFVHLDTKDPRSNNAKDLSDYLKLSPNFQTVQIDFLTATLDFIPEFSKKFDLIITINYVFGVTNCRTYVNYNTCRSNKQKNQQIVIDILNKIIGDKNIVDNLVKGNSTTDKFDSNVLLSLEGIFYMIDNTDSFTKESIKTLLSIMQNIKTHLKDILAQTSNDALKRDIVKIISSYLSIFSDIITFNEYDGYYDKEIDEVTQMIKNEDVNSYIELVTGMTEELTRVGINDMMLEFHEYKVVQLVKDGLDRASIDFENSRIKVDYPNNYLVNKQKGKTIAFTVFNRRYPLRSSTVQKGFQASAISIRVYDENIDLVKVKGLSNANRFILNFLDTANVQYYCHYYDYNLKFKSDGLETVLSDKNPYICYSNHLTDFVRLPTIVKETGLQWWVVLIIVLVVLIVVAGVGFFLYRYFRSKESSGTDKAEPMLLMSTSD